MSKTRRPEKRVNPGSPEEPLEAQFDGYEESTAPSRDWVAITLRGSAFIVLLGAAGGIVWHLLLIEQHLKRQAERDTEHAFWMICRKGSQPEERTAAFKLLVAAGQEDWRIANLRHLKLEGVDLSEVTIKDAHFESCDFKRADLSNTTFEKCSFHMCNFTEANLWGVIGRECKMFKSDFTDANLQNSILINADLEQTIIKGANLSYCDFTTANFYMAEINDSDLRDAILNGVNLRNASLSRTNLATTKMPKLAARYDGVDLTDSNWWRAQGIPSLIQTRCQRKFAPTKNAPKGFYDDYQDWLKSKAKSSVSPPP